MNRPQSPTWILHCVLKGSTYLLTQFHLYASSLNHSSSNVFQTAPRGVTRCPSLHFGDTQRNPCQLKIYIKNDETRDPYLIWRLPLHVTELPRVSSSWPSEWATLAQHTSQQQMATDKLSDKIMTLQPVRCVLISSGLYLISYRK